MTCVKHSDAVVVLADSVHYFDPVQLIDASPETLSRILKGQ